MPRRAVVLGLFNARNWLCRRRGADLRVFLDTMERPPRHRDGKTDRYASRKDATNLAIQALTYLAAEPERLSRFLALTGLEPPSIRTAAEESGFLAGVLEYIAADEAVLLAFAAEGGIEPDAVERACRALASHGWEPNTP